MDNFSSYYSKLSIWLNAFGPKILGAVLVFIIGLYLTNWASTLISKTLHRKKVDVSLQSFLSSLVSVGLKMILLITVAGMLGIQTTSFVAILGALGLAVGLALQGSLANFAGGMLILVFKPFKAGEIIESQGQTGEVIEIQIFNTILLTADHRSVILANGAVSNNTIINYSRQGNLRVDITLAVGTDVSVNEVRDVILEVCYAHPLVLKSPKATVNVSKIDEGNVILNICPFTTATNYWTVYFDIQESIKTAFELNNISLPEPHLFVTQKELVPAQQAAVSL